LFGYLAAFLNAACLNLSDIKKDAKFGAGEISVPIVEALPTAEPREFI